MIFKIQVDIGRLIGTVCDYVTNYKRVVIVTMNTVVHVDDNYNRRALRSVSNLGTMNHQQIFHVKVTRVGGVVVLVGNTISYCAAWDLSIMG